MRHVRAWGSPPSAGHDEREDEAEQGERLGEGDAQEHGGAHHAGGLGLAGHGADGVADDEADADAGADGSAAVDDASTDGGEALDELAFGLLSEDGQHGFLLFPWDWFRAWDQCSAWYELPRYTAVRIVKM